MSGSNDVTFRGERDESLSLTFGTAVDGRLPVVVGVDAGGFTASVPTEVASDEVTGFWFELDALCRGEAGVASLEPASGSPVLELRERTDGAALGVTVRADAGNELRVVFELRQAALGAARDALARVVADLSASGTELWE